MEALLEAILYPIGEVVLGLLSAWDGGSGDRKAEVAPRGPVLAKQICAFCRKKGGRFVTCQTCRTPHHSDCARLNRRCAVYGCKNRKFLVPAA